MTAATPSSMPPSVAPAAVLARVAAGLGEGLAYGIALVAPDLTFEWVSPSSERLLGFRPDELVGRGALEYLHPDDVEAMAAAAAAEVATPNPFGLDPANMATNMIRVRAADGGWRALDMAANNQIGNPAVGAFVLVLRDATAEQLTIEVLQRLARHEPLRSVVGAVADLLLAQIEGASVAAAVHDESGAPVSVARGGRPDRPADIVVTITANDPSSELSVWIPGSEPPTLWCRTLVERGADMVRLALSRDLGVRQLRRAAQTDPLTGAHNRAGLSARLEMLAASSWGGLNAVLYVDLDDFKLVNDTWGHAAGDAALVECARRLRSCLRTDDVLARTGGDEFVAVCAGVPDSAVAGAIASRIVSELARPIEMSVGTVRIGATVGGAVGDRRATPGLIDRADAALLRAKRSGKGRMLFDHE